MENDCIKTCCCKADEHSHDDLTPTNTCVVAPGVYHNVTVEINDRCQLVRLSPADSEAVYLCDPCANG